MSLVSRYVTQVGLDAEETYPESANEFVPTLSFPLFEPYYYIYTANTESVNSQRQIKKKQLTRFSIRFAERIRAEGINPSALDRRIRREQMQDVLSDLYKHARLESKTSSRPPQMRG